MAEINISQFIDKLIELTKADKITWQRFSSYEDLKANALLYEYLSKDNTPKKSSYTFNNLHSFFANFKSGEFFLFSYKRDDFKKEECYEISVQKNYEATVVRLSNNEEDQVQLLCLAEIIESKLSNINDLLTDIFSL